jgi:hypothetical protein
MQKKHRPGEPNRYTINDKNASILDNNIVIYKIVKMAQQRKKMGYMSLK